LITEDEGRLTEFVMDVRAAKAVWALGSDSPAADFVLQISIRSRWIRDLVRQGTDRLVAPVHALLGEKAGRIGFLKREFAKNPEWLRVELVKEAERRFERPLTTAELSLLTAAETAMRAHPERLAEFLPPLPPIKMLCRVADQGTVRGHLKGLEESLATRATEYRDFLSSMQWSVLVAFNQTLVLGDCGPMFFDGSGHAAGPIGIGRQEDLRAVALPMSSNHVLFGAIEGGSLAPSPSALNEAAASWSSEAFIASAESGENAKLHTLISSKLSLFIDEQMESVLRENGL
jgi:hypothetical protein